MTLFAPLWWLFRPLGIFSAFDFTSAEDYAPLMTLILGLVSAAMIARAEHKAEPKASPALMATTLLLSLWPILPNYALFFLAREFQRMNGAWPQVMVDDPKNQLGATSARFDNLFSVVDYMEAFSGAWMIIFLALILQRETFSAAQRRFAFKACVASMIIFVLDFGGLSAWWLD